MSGGILSRGILSGHRFIQVRLNLESLNEENGRTSSVLNGHLESWRVVSKVKPLNELTWLFKLIPP